MNAHDYLILGYVFALGLPLAYGLGLLWRHRAASRRDAGRRQA